MIIRKAGKIIGRLNESTLKLTNVRSTKLQQLVDDWRANGFEEFGPAEFPDDYPGPKPTCAMTMIVVPFTTENLCFAVTRLLIAGFEVQRDR